MADISLRFKRCVMSLSFQERKERELMRYRQEVIRLKSLDDDELDLQYINLKSQYEYKKNIWLIVMLTIIISILMDVWKYFYNFIGKIQQLVILSQRDNIGTVRVVFVITVILIIFITILILGMLVLYMRKMHRTYKNLIVVEEIRNKRQREEG